MPRLDDLARSVDVTGKSHQGGASKPQGGLLQEYAELVTFIRDACIDRTQLRAILGLNPDTLPAGDGNPHAPIK